MPWGGIQDPAPRSAAWTALPMRIAQCQRARPPPGLTRRGRSTRLTRGRALPARGSGACSLHSRAPVRGIALLLEPLLYDNASLQGALLKVMHGSLPGGCGLRGVICEARLASEGCLACNNGGRSSFQVYAGLTLPRQGLLISKQCALVCGTFQVCGSAVSSGLPAARACHGCAARGTGSHSGTWRGWTRGRRAWRRCASTPARRGWPSPTPPPQPSPRTP